MTTGSKPTKIDPSFYDSLDESEKKAWSLFEDGVSDRKSYFHTPIVISKSNKGVAKPRTMVLRKVNRGLLELQFHTDKRSLKVREIASDNLGAVLVYDMEYKIQIRIEAEFRIVEDLHIIQKRWSGMRDMSKECYAVGKPPGTKISDPTRLESLGDGADNFAILSASVLQMEWLYLCYKGNRRALFDYRLGECAKGWLVP